MRGCVLSGLVTVCAHRARPSGCSQHPGLMGFCLQWGLHRVPPKAGTFVSVPRIQPGAFHPEGGYKSKYLFRKATQKQGPLLLAVKPWRDGVGGLRLSWLDLRSAGLMEAT